MEMSLIVKQVWSVAFMSFTIFFVCHKHNSLTLGPIDTSLYLLLLKSSMVNFTFFIIASLQWERDSNAQPRCQNNTTVTIVGTPPPNLLIEFYILAGFDGMHQHHRCSDFNADLEPRNFFLLFALISNYFLIARALLSHNSRLDVLLFLFLFSSKQKSIPSHMDVDY